MKNRFKYFITHLSISLLIAFILILWIFFIWYPMPLSAAVGVSQIFLMMITIDVVIGPLLSLLVYKENKKSLKFDLGIIIALQICALAYGILNIEQGRPAWIAFNVDRFELIRKNEIYTQNIQNTLPQYKNPSWLKPRYVGVAFANSVDEKNQNMYDEVLGGISIAQRPERYVSLEQVKAEMQIRSQKINVLSIYNKKEILTKTLKKYPDANAWLPLKASAVDMVVLINKEKAEVVKIVDLRPWN